MKKNKQDIRQEVYVQRRLISEQEQESVQLKLLENLKPLLTKISSIAIYHAMHGEINLRLVFDYCIQHKIRVYEPIAYKNTKIMRFNEINSENNNSIFYPEDYKLINESKWYNIDLILLPLLAADKYGHRIGQGGGYYDATLSNSLCIKRPILCGVGYSWQFHENIPFDNWDVKLNYFVSENDLCTIIK